MNTNKQKIYSSPDLEVIGIQDETVICQSGGIKDMDKDSDSNW